MRVRQALAYAIDRKASSSTCAAASARRPSASCRPVVGIRRRMLCASPTIPRGPGRCSTRPGYPDPDGDGPRPAFATEAEDLELEFNRLQAAVIQQNLREVGIDLDVRTYEFATLYADVLKGNFQMYTLQWTAGSLADPDILRRVFHSTQVPPAGFNRGHFSDPRVDALLDEAAASTDEARRHRAVPGGPAARGARRALHQPLEQDQLVVAQRSLSGIQVGRWPTCASSRMSPKHVRR